jgi:hypothetical protein
MAKILKVLYQLKAVIEGVFEMRDVESYYDGKAGSYDDMFDMLYFKVYDFITWKFWSLIFPSFLTVWFSTLEEGLDVGLFEWQRRVAEWF